MSLDFPNWKRAIEEFTLYKEATRKAETAHFYRVHLLQLAAWAQEAGVPLEGFRGRDMDRFLVGRAQKGLAETTRRSDFVTANAFFKFCRQAYKLTNPLADYEAPRCAEPFVFKPDSEHIQTLLAALRARWQPQRNHEARFVHAERREFFRVRNYSIVVGLLDTATRVGELLALEEGDYRPEAREIWVRESKGKRPRVIPISQEWIGPMREWLRVREEFLLLRQIAEPEERPSARLFLNELGLPITPCAFSHLFKGYVRYAGLPEEMNLHSLRRYALHELSKRGLMAAQDIAGHRDPKTTRRYTQFDPAHLRAVHEEAGVLRGVMLNRRTEERKRKRVL